MIVISQTALYAMRATSYLAVMADKGPVTSALLAAHTSIPQHYISKVMRRLVTAGICVAQKGHHGGFALARAPESITFAHVIDAVDPVPDKPACAFGFSACDEDRPCALHESWSDLKTRHNQWAATTTLAAVRDSAARAGFRVRV